MSRAGRFVAAAVLAAGALGWLGGYLTATIPAATVSERYSVTDDMVIFRCDYHGNRECGPDAAFPVGSVTITLTGDPLTDCVSAMAGVGLAASLCGPVAVNLG